MNQSRNIHLRALLGDTRGLSTVEYVIILVLIAGVAVGTWKTFGETVVGKINDANAELQDEVVLKKGETAP